MTPQEIATMMDSMDQVLEVVNGYRAKLEAAGYSPTAAEVMAMDFHRLIMGSRPGSVT